MSPDDNFNPVPTSDPNQDQAPDLTPPVAPDLAPAPEPAPAPQPALEDQPVVPPSPFQPFQPTAQPEPTQVVNPTPSPLSQPTPVVNPAPTPMPIVNSEPSSINPGAGSPRKPRRKLLLATIIAVAVVILGGGAAAAYNLYYQNPDKVVTDAFINVGNLKTIDTSTQMTYSDKSVNVKLNANVVYDQTAIQADGNLAISSVGTATPVNVSTNFNGFISKKGDVLLKVANSSDFLKLLAPSDETLVKSVAAKIDNKWISFSTQSDSTSPDATQQCFANVYDKLGKDTSQQNEIINAYKNNMFLIIDKKLAAKTINGVGSLGYQIHLDTNKFYAFGDALKQTTAGKAMLNCDNTVFDAFNRSSSTASDGTQEYEIYASRFGHQLMQFSGTYSKDDKKLSLVTNVKPNSNVKISEPKADTSFQNLTSDIESLYMNYYYTGSTVDIGTVSFGA